MPGTFRPTQPTARRTVAILCGPPPLARLCETTLGRMGLAPRRLSDGADAMRTLETAPPDLLLVLLMGRDPAALALCQAVGQEPAFARTRLVVVQDSARDIDLRRARALGADAVLPLPLDPGMLDRAIRPLLAVPA